MRWLLKSVNEIQW